MRSDHVPQLPLALPSHGRQEDRTGKPVLFLILERAPSQSRPLPRSVPSCHTLILTLTSTENRLLQPGARLM